MGYDKQSHFHFYHQCQTEMQPEISGIQSADDDHDVTYEVTLIGESLCTFSDRLAEHLLHFLPVPLKFSEFQ